MSRRIVTTQYQAASDEVRIDNYFDRIIKYIPADVIGAWIATVGIVSSFAASDTPKETILWVAFAVGIIFTAMWTWKQTTVQGKPVAVTQIIISIGAFIVLVFALGEPFAGLSWYDPGYGSLSLIFYALFVGMITPNE
ncbi:MAG: hypothetical protein KAI83_00600 [Thiomargarita sp.]|nr:hypothetical protein [Thiomargarita sp.]